MVSSIITIGDKINLTKYRHSDEINSETKQYVSSILDVNEGEFLHVGMPTDGGHMVVFEVGEKFQVFIYTKRGLYLCTAVVIDRYREGNLHVAILRILTDLVRQQRRQFYRLEKIMNIMHCLYEEMTDTEESYNYQFKAAVLTDISGGGARYTCDERFDKGALVLLKVVLSQHNVDQEYILKARVISSQMLTNKVGLYENRVEFSEIKTSEREAIIRYIFEEERKQRRREKGLV